MRSTAAALVGAQLRAMVRDRTVVVFVVVLPVALMVVLGNVYAAEAGGALRVAVHAEVDGDVAGLLTSRLADDASLDVTIASSAAELDDLVRRGDVHAGVVVTRGGVDLVGPPDVEAPVGARRVVEAIVAEVGLAAAVAERIGVPLAAAAAALATDRPPVELSSDGARREAAIATIVLVTFMNLVAVGSLVPGHRRIGVLDRLVSAPVGPHQIVAGYLALFVFVAATNVTVSLVAGRVLLGIEWGPMPVVAALAAGLSIAAGALGTLAGTLLPTPESGTSIGGPIGFVLGMVGGCLWPLEIVGRPLQLLGRLTPHAWVRDGFVAAGDGAVPPATFAVLAATALGAAALASARLARSLR